MEYLVISDLHLTEFNKAKFDYLSGLFSRYENIILNGDLWTNYYKDFDYFVKSDWSKLFPILKSKNTIYIEGNHDLFKTSDERINLFSNDHKKELIVEIDNEKYIIRHGHTYFKRTKTDLEKKLWRKLGLYKLRIFVEKLIAKHFGRDLYQAFCSKDNQKIKDAKRNSEEKDLWLLTGHTHVSEFNFKEKFVNTGFTNYGLATFAVLTAQGPKLYNESF